MYTTVFSKGVELRFTHWLQEFPQRWYLFHDLLVPSPVSFAPYGGTVILKWWIGVADGKQFQGRDGLRSYCHLISLDSRDTHYSVFALTPSFRKPTSLSPVKRTVQQRNALENNQNIALLHRCCLKLSNFIGGHRCMEFSLNLVEKRPQLASPRTTHTRISAF